MVLGNPWNPNRPSLKSWKDRGWSVGAGGAVEGDDGVAGVGGSAADGEFGAAAVCGVAAAATSKGRTPWGSGWGCTHAAVEAGASGADEAARGACPKGQGMNPKDPNVSHR